MRELNLKLLTLAPSPESMLQKGIEKMMNEAKDFIQQKETNVLSIFKDIESENQLILQFEKDAKQIEAELISFTIEEDHLSVAASNKRQKKLNEQEKVHPIDVITCHNSTSGVQINNNSAVKCNDEVEIIESNSNST